MADTESSARLPTLVAMTKVFNGAGGKLSGVPFHPMFPGEALLTLECGWFETPEGEYSKPGSMGPPVTIQDDFTFPLVLAVFTEGEDYPRAGARVEELMSSVVTEFVERPSRFTDPGADQVPGLLQLSLIGGIGPHPYAGQFGYGAVAEVKFAGISRFQRGTV